MWGRGEDRAGGAAEVIVITGCRLHVTGLVYLKRGGLDCQIYLTEGIGIKRFGGVLKFGSHTLKALAIKNEKF